MSWAGDVGAAAGDVIDDEVKTAQVDVDAGAPVSDRPYHGLANDGGAGAGGGAAGRRGAVRDHRCAGRG
jgi:hypothetical protein